MAKSISPNDQGANDDVLKAAAAAKAPTAAATNTGTPGAAGNAAGPVNQGEVKKEAEQLGNQAQEQKTDANLSAGTAGQARKDPAPNEDKPFINPGSEERAEVLRALYPTDDDKAEAEAKADYEDFIKFKKQKAAAAAKAQAEAEATKLKDGEHEALEKKYGKGYVRARKGTEINIFTALTWGQMIDKVGWSPIVATPPEIAHLVK